MRDNLIYGDNDDVYEMNDDDADDDVDDDDDNDSYEGDEDEDDRNCSHCSQAVTGLVKGILIVHHCVSH